MRLIDADRALEIVRDQGIAHPNAYHLTNYATLILREAPAITDLSKCIEFNSAADDKQKTNADRIRAMSDEELADMLWKTGRNYRAICADPVVDYNEQHEHLVDWLQQPAEEG